MQRKGRRRVMLAALLLMPVAAARAEVTIQDPGTYVVDRADIVDATYEQRLNGWLRELEQKTTAQVKVLTVPRLEGESLFDFTHRHAELWKLGQKGKDNGVLLTVALKERKDRIHVGYGLEGVLPDSWCGTLRRQIIIPYFKKNQFSEGLFRATVAIANKIADSQNVTLTGMPAYRVQAASRRVGPGVRGGGCACSGLLPLIIFFIVLSSLGRRGRHRSRWGGGGLMQGLLLGSLMSSMMGGGRSRWGGGFGGGGFSGGFGGGGFGGSFGGGGGFGGGGAGGGGW